MLTIIREFFAKHKVLEVDTPLLASAPATDPHLAAFVTHTALEQRLYLQTSPEFAMKRLIAAGSGSIYQICKAFRQDESGKLHNPEFTMLEWYRLGFDAEDLMDEVLALISLILPITASKRCSYGDIFSKQLGINPHSGALSDLLNLVAQHTDVKISKDEIDRDLALQLLFSAKCEPALGHDTPCFIYDFPKEQAALARLNTVGGHLVASRFELYYQGVELANGYHELTDHQEQMERMQSDLQKRHALGLPAVPIDNKLIAALKSGIEACAGVAMGLDRLLMLSVSEQDISKILAFSHSTK